MSAGKAEQLACMLNVCRGLDADVRCSAADGHITVQAWEDRAELARSVQQTLLQQSAQ